MHIKEQTQLQTLLDNRDAIFSEFSSNKPNLDSEMMIGDNKVYIVSTINNIFTNNKNLSPTLINLLDGTLSIMVVSFYSSGEDTHPLMYPLRWDLNYPISRYYMANSGNKTVGLVDRTDVDSILIKDWLTDEEIDFNEDSSSANNIYMSLDIWNPTQTPTPTQIDNFYKFYKNFPAVVKLSSPLQSFVDAI